MSQQFIDHSDGITRTYKTLRQFAAYFAAYIVFGLSMGFLFGTLVQSLFVGVLFGVALGLFGLVRPDFHRRKTIIDRESVRTAQAATSEPDIWRSAIILPTRYAAEAALGSVKRADALLDHGDVRGSLAWIRTPKTITDLERRTPTAGDTVH